MPENGGDSPAPVRAPIVRGGRSLAGEIRSRLDWIEAELRAGHSLAQIAAALNEVGITISAENFKKALYRARKERDATSTVPAGVVQNGAANELEMAPKASLKSLQLEAAERTQAAPAIAPSPPKAAIQHLTMAEAMDPKKRAAFADQFFVKEPLVIPSKRKSES